MFWLKASLGNAWIPLLNALDVNIGIETTPAILLNHFLRCCPSTVEEAKDSRRIRFFIPFRLILEPHTARREKRSCPGGSFPNISLSCSEDERAFIEDACQTNSFSSRTKTNTTSSTHQDPSFENSRMPQL